eukprot:6189319-Pleurochrysis_carterae.AAC.2
MKKDQGKDWITPSAASCDGQTRQVEIKSPSAPLPRRRKAARHPPSARSATATHTGTQPITKSSLLITHTIGSKWST